MSNYDSFADAVKELSGGSNIVLLDDLNKPSVYVTVPKMKISDIVAGGSENVHPAFSVDGVEKNEFYYSKYPNIIVNDRAYSLGRRDAAVYVNWDRARQVCENKGTGFHLGTLAEWSAIALRERKAGTMPHGNNNWGCDIDHPYERGVEASKDGDKTGRVFTGSGPATWFTGYTRDGIWGLNGNVYDWLGGMRLYNGQIQIIPYNNAAMGAKCDMSASSTLWKAIAADGSIVETTAEKTLHYSDTANQLVTANHTDGKTGSSGSFSAMSLEADLTAPELAKALIFYPNEPGKDYGGDYHWWNTDGERLPLAGGSWDSQTAAGVFRLDLGNPRSFAGTSVGFRSAYVSL